MTFIETAEQDKFDGITIQVPTPDGAMFVTIMEDVTSKPVGIQIHIGKAGGALAAWASALSRIMSLALDNGATINDLITELSSHTSDRRRETSKGESVRSGIEGIWTALMQYKRDKYALTAATLGDDRSGKLGG